MMEQTRENAGQKLFGSIRSFATLPIRAIGSRDFKGK